MSGMGRRVSLPLIPRESWRRQAVCPERVGERLWDDRVDGEQDEERRARHEKAKTICWGLCPVREDCSDDADWRYDEGIRGGHKLPSTDGLVTAAETEMLRLMKKG